MKKLLLACLLACSLCFLVFYNREKPYIIPITLSSSSIPQALVDIQGNKYQLDVDLGSKHPLFLKQGVLASIEKTSCGTVQSRNFKGDVWEFPAYQMAEMKMGDLAFHDVVAVGKTDEYSCSEIVSGPLNEREEEAAEKVGSIGRPLLEKSNLLFDIPHQVLISSSQKKQLKKLGYSLEDYAHVSFQKGRVCPIIKVATDLGELNLAVDTGSTFSYIRSSGVEKQKVEEAPQDGLARVITEHLQIGNRDFGSQDLYLLDIASELTEIDGILGMDFIQDHLIYIDQQEQTIYIK